MFDYFFTIFLEKIQLNVDSLIQAFSLFKVERKARTSVKNIYKCSGTKTKHYKKKNLFECIEIRIDFENKYKIILNITNIVNIFTHSRDG